MATFLIALLIVCVLIGVVMSAKGKHHTNEQALNSPFRDKIVYRDLLLSKKLIKGLLLAFVVMAVLLTRKQNKVSYTPHSVDSERTIENTLNVDDSSRKNVTYEGNKKVYKKPLNTGDPSY